MEHYCNRVIICSYWKKDYYVCAGWGYMSRTCNRVNGGSGFGGEDIAIYIRGWKGLELRW